MALGEKPINQLTPDELDSEIAHAGHSSPRMASLMKEREHRFTVASQKTKPNKNPDEHWYKKPPGIIIIGVTVAVLAAIAKYLLGL